jgi:hypothetical protein
MNNVLRIGSSSLALARLAALLTVGHINEV